MAKRRELKEAIGQRYRAAGNWERRQILDEFTGVTGYDRKHPPRELHRPFVPRPPRARNRIYNEAVRHTGDAMGDRRSNLRQTISGAVSGADREHGTERAPQA